MVVYHITREIKFTYPEGSEPAGWTNVYIGKHPIWEHVEDSSTCAKGLNIPLKVWSPVGLPIRCEDGREIRTRYTHIPFYIDDLPI